MLHDAYEAQYPDTKEGTTALARKTAVLAQRDYEGSKVTHSAVHQVLKGPSQSSWFLPYLAEALKVPVYDVIVGLSEEERSMVAAYRLVRADAPARAAKFVEQTMERAVDISKAGDGKQEPPEPLPPTGQPARR